jgi:hypothetical protein
MKTRQFLTRDAALSYLGSRHEFTRLYTDRRGNGRAIEDLGTAQAKRYANRLYQALRAGVDTSKWRDLGPLRGHEASERHKGRTNKPGYENYIPPDRLKLGKFFNHNAEGAIVSDLRVTKGERTAEQAILGGVMQKVHGRPRQVAINITGGREGQYAQLFWKGGWNAEQLLEMAGWRKSGLTGKWGRSHGAKGLEEALLDYIATLPWAKYERWGSISLYEVYVYDEPIREVADPESRWTEREYREYREEMADIEERAKDYLTKR